MKVYLVSTGCYSDWSIEGIFSTKKKAERFISNCRNAEACYNKDFNNIGEYTLDAELSQTAFTEFWCSIWLDDGSSRGGEASTSRNVFGIPKSNIFLSEHVPLYDGRGIVRAISHISSKHALKLAAEARQNWLREKGITKAVPAVPHD